MHGWTPKMLRKSIVGEVENIAGMATLTTGARTHNDGHRRISEYSKRESVSEYVRKIKNDPARGS
jgi:hypothetical protein